MSAAFSLTFGGTPEVWARAPGRVDLMGSHTDYNEGYVLTMAVNRDTWVAAAPSSDERVRALSLNFDQLIEFPTAEPLQGISNSWDSYIRGVVHVFQQAGYAVSGFDAVMHGTVPLGGGLSSSASLECSLGVALKTLGEHPIRCLEMAQLCQRAENDVVGMKCGILDQYSSMMAERGNSVLLDCRSLTHELSPVPDSVGIVICDTRTSRELAGSEYGDRRAQCEEGAKILSGICPGVKTLRDISVSQFRMTEHHLPGEVRRRCRFIINENQRVRELAAALAAHDRIAISSLCADSFTGARDLFEITIPEMEVMLDSARRAPGMIGARQAGAGFGGSMVAFVDDKYTNEFCSYAAGAYEDATGIKPDLFPVEPADGACLIEGTDDEA